MKTKVKLKKWQIKHMINSLYDRLSQTEKKKEIKKINKIIDKLEK